MPRDRHGGRRTGERAAGTVVRLALLALAASALSACAANAAPSPSPTPRPTPTPAPTPTPLPGAELPPDYRPEGEWLVTFALPGDFVRETWTIILTCPTDACDAIAQVRDERGRKLEETTFAWADGRYQSTSERTWTADCDAHGTRVRDGATATATTQLVLAGFALPGTANVQRRLQGTRTVVLAPVGDSGCAARTLVYPATGDLVEPEP